MEVKHTPLPWTAEEGAARGAWIMGANGGWSALACGDDDETAIANTAFIQRACNSHYDLLEALKEARETILQLKNARWSEAEGYDDEWVGDIDAAIAKAEAS